MKHETDFDLIENYLNGSLSQQERADVELRILKDASFADELAAHQAANDIISYNANLELKKQLQNIHQEENIKKLKGYRNLFYVSVGLISIAGLLTLFFPKNNQPNKQEKVVTFTTKDSSVLISEKESIEPALPLSASGFDRLNHPDSAQEALQVGSNHPEIEKNTPSQKESGFTENNSSEEKKKLNPNIDKADPNKSLGSVLPEKAKEDLPIVDKAQEKNPCTTILEEPKISVTSSCSEKSTGMVIVQKEKMDASVSYEFSIDAGKSFNSNNIFKNLAAGNYTLVIKDENNCKSNPLNVIIENENCDAVVYPLQQVYWEVPLKRFADEQVLLKIMNARTGAVVYNKIISSSLSYSWTGVDNNENSLPMGAYVYELSGKDPRLTITGQLTIVK